MKYLVNRYKQLKLSTLLYVWGTVFAISLGLMVVNKDYHHALGYILTPIVSAIVLDLLIRIPRIIFSFILIAAQIFMFSMLTLNSLGNSIGIVSLNSIPNYTATAYILFGGMTISTLLVLCIAVLWSKGRIWVNLAISYLLMDSVFIALYNHEAYIPMLSGSLVGILYVIARIFLYRRQKYTMEDVTYPKQNNFVKTLQITKAFDSEATTTSLNEEYPIDFFKATLQKDKKTQYDIFGTSFSNSKFIYNGRELYIDSHNITPFLENLLRDLKRVSKQQKIKRKRIVPIIVVDETGDKIKDIVSVALRNKKRPDFRIGEVMICEQGSLKKLYNYLTN